MTVLLIRFSFIILLSFGLTSMTVARSILPAPPNTQIGSLGKQMTVNGLPMQIRQFSSKQSERNVIEFYKNLWDDGSELESINYHISTDLKPWTIITRVEDNQLLSVQVKSDDRRTSSGYLSISSLDPKQMRKPGEDYPYLKGSQVLNDVISEDYGKHGRNLLIKNTKSLQSNATFYRQYYTRLGWQEIKELPNSKKAQILQFKRLNKNVTLILKEQAGATLITSQIVTEGLF